MRAHSQHRRLVPQTPFWRLTPAILLLAVPLGASAQSPSHGPLTYEEGSPLQRISYTAMMEDAAITSRGTVVADLWLGFSNIFEQDSTATHVLFLDMERLVSALTVRWGAIDRLERSFGAFSAVVQYQIQSPVLESFHHRELDRSPANVIVGLSGGVGERWRWDASFQEDMPADTPAIDLTLGLRVSRSW